MTDFSLNEQGILLPVPGIRMDLPLTNGLYLDCYELPDETKRVGKEQGSKALGHAHNWIGRVHKTTSKLLKALQDTGYTGVLIPQSQMP